MFNTLFGYWVHRGGGLPTDWYITCLCSFFTLDCSKIKGFKTFFFDTVITKNDQSVF